jgi:cystathionine beta-lyase/cystathionine gamma-synthase
MKKHEENAIKIAHWLTNHPKAESVIYPGLETHPQHRAGQGTNGRLRSDDYIPIKGGLETVQRFVKGLEVFLFAESLGGVESLVAILDMSHGVMSPDEKKKIGITEGTIRLSIGIEDSDDLIKDIDNALERC